MVTVLGKMLLTIFTDIAHFERDLTSERIKGGIHAARKRGKHSGRPKTDEEKVGYALYLMDQGLNRTDASEKAEISRMSLFRKLKDNSLLSNLQGLELTANVWQITLLLILAKYLQQPMLKIS